MQEINGLVSVIIPAYNAENFIEDTIDSVVKQSYSQWEIWVVNDGSKDNTENKVKAITDNRIFCISQANAGVSAARNNGLTRANGEFIVFLDADDLLTPEFLKVRVESFRLRADIGFVGGVVEKFPGKTEQFKPAADEPEKEVLFFDKGCVTIPSNYMIRHTVLQKHGIHFNTALSSTADKFFILQLSKVCKGFFVNTDSGKLLYRVNEQSMSHKVSHKLMLDNEQFYSELKRYQLLPIQNTTLFKAMFFWGLAIGFFQVRFFAKSFLYLWRSFITSPSWFIKRIIKGSK